jgi:capsular polysaccharide biosynthesis protein
VYNQLRDKAWKHHLSAEQYAAVKDIERKGQSYFALKPMLEMHGPQGEFDVPKFELHQHQQKDGRVFSSEELIAAKRLVVVERKSSRHILNLEEVKAHLEKRHVPHSVVSLEGMSVADQVKLFSNATMIMGVHGNALGNMLWMPAGSVVVSGALASSNT